MPDSLQPSDEFAAKLMNLHADGLTDMTRKIIKAYTESDAKKLTRKLVNLTGYVPAQKIFIAFDQLRASAVELKRLEIWRPFLFRDIFEVIGALGEEFAVFIRQEKNNIHADILSVRMQLSKWNVPEQAISMELINKFDRAIRPKSSDLRQGMNKASKFETLIVRAPGKRLCLLSREDAEKEQRRKRLEKEKLEAAPNKAGLSAHNNAIGIVDPGLACTPSSPSHVGNAHARSRPTSREPTLDRETSKYSNNNDDDDDDDARGREVKNELLRSRPRAILTPRANVSVGTAPSRGGAPPPADMASDLREKQPTRSSNIVMMEPNSLHRRSSRSRSRARSPPHAAARKDDDNGPRRSHPRGGEQCKSPRSPGAAARKDNEEKSKDKQRGQSRERKRSRSCSKSTRPAKRVKDGPSSEAADTSGCVVLKKKEKSTQNEKEKEKKSSMTSEKARNHDDAPVVGKKKCKDDIVENPKSKPSDGDGERERAPPKDKLPRRSSMTAQDDGERERGTMIKRDDDDVNRTPTNDNGLACARDRDGERDDRKDDGDDREARNDRNHDDDKAHSHHGNNYHGSDSESEESFIFVDLEESDLEDMEEGRRSPVGRPRSPSVESEMRCDHGLSDSERRDEPEKSRPRSAGSRPRSARSSERNVLRREESENQEEKSRVKETKSKSRSTKSRSGRSRDEGNALRREDQEEKPRVKEEAKPAESGKEASQPGGAQSSDKCKKEPCGKSPSLPNSLPIQSKAPGPALGGSSGSGTKMAVKCELQANPAKQQVKNPSIIAAPPVPSTPATSSDKFNVYRRFSGAPLVQNSNYMKQQIARRLEKPAEKPTISIVGPPPNMPKFPIDPAIWIKNFEKLPPPSAAKKVNRRHCSRKRSSSRKPLSSRSRSRDKTNDKNWNSGLTRLELQVLYHSIPSVTEDKRIKNKSIEETCEDHPLLVDLCKQISIEALELLTNSVKIGTVAPIPPAWQKPVPKVNLLQQGLPRTPKANAVINFKRPFGRNPMKTQGLKPVHVRSMFQAHRNPRIPTPGPVVAAPRMKGRGKGGRVPPVASPLTRHVPLPATRQKSIVGPNRATAPGFGRGNTSGSRVSGFPSLGRGRAINFGGAAAAPRPLISYGSRALAAPAAGGAHPNVDPATRRILARRAANSVAAGMIGGSGPIGLPNRPSRVISGSSRYGNLVPTRRRKR